MLSLIDTNPVRTDEAFVFKIACSFFVWKKPKTNQNKVQEMAHWSKGPAKQKIA